MNKESNSPIVFIFEESPLVYKIISSVISDDSQTTLSGGTGRRNVINLNNIYIITRFELGLREDR